MKLVLGLMQSLFMMYFVFVHPAIIYYADTNRAVYPEPTFFYASIAIWSVIFIAILILIYNISFVKKKHMENVLQSGIRLEGKIVTSTIKKITSKNMEQRDLIIELPNLKGEMIQHRLIVLDSKPWEKRYEKGNKVIMRVDPQLNKTPVIVLEGMKTKINYTLYIVWLLFLIGIIAYYYFVFQIEGQGKDWTFFGPWHPIIISSYCLLGFTGIFYYIINRFFIRISGKKKIQLKFNGRKAEAKILSMNETGTRINHQPVIRFELEFKDHLGRTMQAEVKKVVSLVKLATAKEESKIIFYLEESPQTIALEDELLESH